MAWTLLNHPPAKVGRVSSQASGPRSGMESQWWNRGWNGAALRCFCHLIGADREDALSAGILNRAFVSPERTRSFAAKNSEYRPGCPGSAQEILRLPWGSNDSVRFRRRAERTHISTVNQFFEKHVTIGRCPFVREMVHVTLSLFCWMLDRTKFGLLVDS